MSFKSHAGTAALLAALLLDPAAALADHVDTSAAVPPFYQDVMKMKPEGKLGQIIKKEKVDTPVPCAQA